MLLVERFPTLPEGLQGILSNRAVLLDTERNDFLDYFFLLSSVAWFNLNKAAF